MRAALRALAFGVALFPLCLILHELSHLAVLRALGGTGALIVRPWRFEFLPATLPSLHVTGGPGLDPLRRVLFDLGGPLLAAVPLLVLAWLVRERALRAALFANVGILCFFAIIETADYLLDSRLGRDFPLLTWEEFNYGMPLLAVLVAAFTVRLRVAPLRASIRGT
jgi:hypothetical protein